MHGSSSRTPGTERNGSDGQGVVVTLPLNDRERATFAWVLRQQTCPNDYQALEVEQLHAELLKSSAVTMDLDRLEAMFRGAFDAAMSDTDWWAISGVAALLGRIVRSIPEPDDVISLDLSESEARNVRPALYEWASWLVKMEEKGSIRDRMAAAARSVDLCRVADALESDPVLSWSRGGLTAALEIVAESGRWLEELPLVDRWATIGACGNVLARIVMDDA